MEALAMHEHILEEARARMHVSEQLDRLFEHAGHLRNLVDVVKFGHEDEV